MADTHDSTTTQLAWKAVSTLAGVVGGIASRKLLQSAWSAIGVSDQEPPLNPADRRVDWVTAAEWAVAAGVGVGLARLMSQRAAAAGWEAATGSPPPGIAT